MIQDSFRTIVQRIQTKDKQGLYNGNVYPLVNIAIPETIPIELIYLTTCEPGAIKGPHVHDPPKWDRFVCVSGEGVIICRNDETGEYIEWKVSEFFPCIITIPPGNSHAIVSRDGCTVLSICNERFYPGHYNQRETTFPPEVFQRWLTDEQE